MSASTIDWKQFEDDPDVIVLEGSQRAGSQYHFYMETQSAIAYPTEEGGVKVYASTQSPDDIQGEVAKVCNLAANLVTIKVIFLFLNPASYFNGLFYCVSTISMIISFKATSLALCTMFLAPWMLLLKERDTNPIIL